MKHLRACGSLVLAVVALFTLGVGPARAADLLVDSAPRAKAELSDPPGWVTLVFRRQVDRSVAKMVVTNADGTNVAVNALIVEGTNVTTQLQSGLPKGTYTVHYRINRPDGQPEGGAFQFAYGRGSWTKLPDASWSGSANEPDILSNPNPRAVTKAPEQEPTEVRPPIEIEQSDGTTVTPVVPTPTPTAIEPTPTPVVSDGVTLTPTAEPQPAGQTSSDSSWLPWVLGGGLVAGAAAGGAWLVNRRKQG